MELKGQVEMKEVECSETMRDGAEETGASKPHVNFRTSKVRATLANHSDASSCGKAGFMIS